MSAKQTVAVMGLGRMGWPMAVNLAKAGFEVRGWNRTARSWPAPAERLAIVPDAADAVAGAQCVILVLSDADAVEDLLFTTGLARQLRASAVVIDMGTCGPRAACDHAHRLNALGAEYLDAPVSGGVTGATNASLTILVGGKAATFAAAHPVLSALGTPHHLGPVGVGQTAKLANQLIVAGYIAAVAEGVAFAEMQGLNATALLEALEGGFADSTILRQHGRRMARREFVPGGTCRLHLKDLRLAASLTVGQMRRLAHTQLIIDRFEHLDRSGYGGLDHSAYVLTCTQTELEMRGAGTS